MLERPTATALTPTGNGVADATFVYEHNDGNPGFAQLIEVNASGGTSYAYGYDAAGRRDVVIQRTWGKEFGSVFEYDELDRVKRRLFPDNDIIEYGYDGIRLVSIRADRWNAGFKGTVLKSADYDALGRMKSIEVGIGSGGATLVTNTYSYDPTNARLTRVLGTPGNLLANDPDGDRVGPQVTSASTPPTRRTPTAAVLGRRARRTGSATPAVAATWTRAGTSRARARRRSARTPRTRLRSR